MTDVKEVKPKRTRKAKVAQEPAVLAVEPRASFQLTGDHEYRILTSPICSLFLDTFEGTLASTVGAQSNDLNQAHLSGKKAGGSLWSAVDKSIVVALGAEVNSAWHTTHSQQITPSGARATTTTSIGDGRRRIKPVSLNTLEIPMYPKASIASGDFALNDSSTSGKQLGAIVCDTDGVVYVAVGKEVTDKWIALSGGADVTPSARTFNAMKTFTGQRGLSRQVYVAAIPAPVVSLDILSIRGNPINDTRYSGKTSGAVVCYTNADKSQVGLAVALGSADNAKWAKLIDATEITPV